MPRQRRAARTCRPVKWSAAAPWRPRWRGGAGEAIRCNGSFCPRNAVFARHPAFRRAVFLRRPASGRGETSGGRGKSGMKPLSLFWMLGGGGVRSAAMPSIFISRETMSGACPGLRRHVRGGVPSRSPAVGGSGGRGGRFWKLGTF